MTIMLLKSVVHSTDWSVISPPHTEMYLNKLWKTIWHTVRRKCKENLQGGTLCVCVVLLACTSKQVCRGQVGMWAIAVDTKDCAFCHPEEGCVPKLVRDVDRRQARQHRERMAPVCLYARACMRVFWCVWFVHSGPQETDFPAWLLFFLRL